jgi:HPt (histidine-containing phosphotransfer) domain-containing protein
MSTLEREIDREFLNNYYKEMVNEVGEIFQLFLSETPSEMEKLKLAYHASDYKLTAELLHKIAPSFYNVGLPALTKSAKEIETSIHSGQTENVGEKLESFYADFDAYMPAVENESKRLEAFM